MSVAHNLHKRTGSKKSNSQQYEIIQIKINTRSNKPFFRRNFHVIIIFILCYSTTSFDFDIDSIR
uniref:Ovule protein n=1 Tax=Romanomermis culicivorax TaxID=13658 RepID=A0A915JBU6_ROMCU